MSTERGDRCPDCRAAPSLGHLPNCDVARCPECGVQRVQCEDHTSSRRSSIWTGRWPGEAEAEREGWWAHFVEGNGWAECGPDQPGAMPDLNRVARAGLVTGDLVWDRSAQQWIPPGERPRRYGKGRAAAPSLKRAGATPTISLK